MPPFARSRSAASSAIAPWVSLGGRLVLAGVLGYAALSKIADPAATVRAVRAYRILPDSLAVPFGHALPWVELTMAVLLLLGLAVRIAGAAAAVLLAVFVAGVVSVAARGLRIDCGCFGGGGATAHPHYTAEIVRDLAFLAISVAVAAIPGSRLALDPQPPTAVPEPAQGRDAQRRHRVAVTRFAAQQAETSRRRRLNAALAAGAVVMMTLTGISVGHSSAAAGSLVVPAAATADGGILVGSATALHHVVAYEDPQCPICGEFEQGIGATLARAVAEGKVNVEYRMMS
ncbi:MAG: hypothetical protein QOD91_185, partial [Frankiales bacterium]|nr:hypothetical protein [Frankiales bacterium]